MELKPSLKDYAEPEFLAFVERIWNVECSQHEHDTWIAHFDRLVGHPAGSDLLFYSNADEIGAVNSPGHIVETLKRWHQQKGNAAFKGQVLQPAVVRPTLTRQQRATRDSKRALEQVRKRVAEAQAAERQLMLKLDALQRQLGNDPQPSLAASHAALRELEVAQHQARYAMAELKRLQMPLKFARDAASRDLSSPFRDAAIQAQLLQEISTASQRHAQALGLAQARHPALDSRAVAMIERLGLRVAELAKATASGPGHGPLTLAAPAHSAGLYPALLTARGISRDTARHLHPLSAALRSAVAELEWQATAMQGEHPGTYADIVEFMQPSPSDDPRFVLTLPLVELRESEGADLARLADQRGEVELPLRLCSVARSTSTSGIEPTNVQPLSRYQHVLMTTTQGLPARVRVRPAAWDAARQALVYTHAGRARVTVQWLRSSTAHAPIDHTQPPVIGYLRLPEVPLIERFADLGQVRFDDCIVVFPADSGLAPVYLMFSEGREPIA